MKLSIRKRMISLMLACILVVPYVTVASGTTSDDLENVKKEQSSVDKELQKTQERLDAIEKDRNNTEAYIRQLDTEQAAIDTELASLNTQIEDKEVEIAENEIKLEEAKVNSQEQYESMKLRIKYMYEQNSESYIETVISSTSMGDMLNKVEYINKIAQYDRDALTRYVETEQMIADTEELLRSDYEAIVAAKASVEAKKAALQLVQNTKIQEINNLKSQESTAVAYRQKLEKDKQALEVEAEKIEAKIAAEEEANKNNGNNGSFITGKYTWPVPASHRVTSAYGDTSGRTSPHKGIDIGASVPGRAGDQIVAINGGRVVISQYSLSAGNYIMIYHGDGLYTRYLHCSSLLVSVGQIVTAGQVIALMGTTGDSTGVHLHMDVRLNGAYVNPSPYIGH